MTKYFKPGIELVGTGQKPKSDLDRAILYVLAESDCLKVRHRPGLPPQLLVEIGEKIIEIGKRLQQ